VKRKLLIGIGLIGLIFVLSAVFVLVNLAVITRDQDLEKQHEQVLTRYRTMLYLARSAQADLYRQQAGYTRNIDDVVEQMLEFEDTISLLKTDFSRSRSDKDCVRCHSSVSGKSAEAVLAGIIDDLKAYESAINLVVTSRDRQLADAFEGDATVSGEQMIAAIDNLRRRTLEMAVRNEMSQAVAIARSRYSIYVTLVIGAVFSLVVGVLLLRSITRPLNILVEGVARVSSGDFEAKVPVSSADEIGFLAATFNDMTANLARMTGEKEALLAELREMNSSLERRVQDATEQLRMAHEKMLRNETLSAVGTFASGVAHELATPLSSVLSYFQMVKGRIAADERLVGDIALIEGELVRCRQILRGMLDFARAPETDKTAINVNAIIAEMLALVQYQKEYKKVTIVQQLDQGVTNVMAVPGQLKQVFLNIILNALQSMQEGGVLTVSSFMAAEGEAARVVVRVSDTGSGIPHEELNRIFQPFFTTKKSGTGLGLPISYGIVRAHGGHIEVQSEAGKGTTFSVYLPAVISYQGQETASVQGKT
jgi:two-component system NtrC family sensor kinase